MPSPFWPLPISLIHGPNIPGSYAILFLRTSDTTSITSHIQNWALFSLWLRLFILPAVISPLFCSSTLGTYWSGEFIFQSHIFAFSYCSENFHTVQRVFILFRVLTKCAPLEKGMASHFLPWEPHENGKPSLPSKGRKHYSCWFL